MFSLTTPRLTIRPFMRDDLTAIHDILDLEEARGDPDQAGRLSLAQRQAWLAWSIASYQQLAALHQPPYGDRAVVRRDTGHVIGACGFAPILMPFGQLPGFASEAVPGNRHWPEVGLYWAIASLQRRQGYATEVGRALIEYGFTTLQLRRIVATTDYDNQASIGVIRKLGMRIERNPFPNPPWLQVVGVLEWSDWQGKM